MTKALAQTYTIAHEYRRQITLALLATCLVFAFGYAINLYRVISYTVALRQIEAETVAADAAIRTLDAEYLGVSGAITPESLRSHGFSQGKVSAFISRTAPLGRSLLPGYEL